MHGLDLISRTDSGNVQEYHLYDGLGSTVALADGGGNVTGTYLYDAFGSVRAQTGATTEWSYTGEQNDPTGLEYLRARYYDPVAGRFLSKDPLPFLQRYSYTGSDPINYVDPTGHCLIEVRLKKVGPEVGVGPLNVQAWHAYIYTYDPIDKSEKAYRGGPERADAGDYVLDWFNFDSYSFGRLGHGDILVQSGWYDDFPDHSADFDGPRRTVRDEDDESCRSWRRSFSGTQAAINESGIGYDLLDQNSNSVVRELLEQASLSTKKPGQRRFWTDRYWIPGWNTQLIDD